MKMKKKCKCNLCKKYSKVQSVLLENNINKLKKTIDNLLEDLANISSDADYYKAILEGNWPTSVHILRKSLKTAERKRQNEKIF